MGLFDRFGRRELQPPTIPIKTMVLPPLQPPVQPLTPPSFVSTQIQPLRVSPPVPIEKPEFEKTVIATSEEAPVFIKIDRYEDILGELSSMKSTVANVQNILELFSMVRDINSDSVSILDSLLKELERSQMRLEKILGRLEAVEERVKESKYEVKKTPEPGGMDDIEKRIKKLKEEIQRLEKLNI